MFVWGSIRLHLPTYPYMPLYLTDYTSLAPHYNLTTIGPPSHYIPLHLATSRFSSEQFRHHLALSVRLTMPHHNLTTPPSHYISSSRYTSIRNHLAIYNAAPSYSSTSRYTSLKSLHHFSTFCHASPQSCKQLATLRCTWLHRYILPHLTTISP